LPPPVPVPLLVGQSAKGFGSLEPPLHFRATTPIETVTNTSKLNIVFICVSLVFSLTRDSDIQR